MKKRFLSFLITLIFTGLVTPCLWAATEDQPPEKSPVTAIIYALLPIFIIGGLLWLFLRKSQQSPLAKRQLQYFDNYDLHQQRQEQLLERIAVALEKKDKNPE